MRRRSFLLGVGGVPLPSEWLPRGAESGLGTLAYLKQDGLWIRRLPSGKEKKIAAGLHLRSPRVSPSGKWISYLEGDTLRVVSHDGSAKAELGKIDGWSPERTAQWRPDQDELLVANTSGLPGLSGVDTSGLIVFSPVNSWNERVREIKHVGFPIAFDSRGREVAFGDFVTTDGHGVESEPMRNGRLCRTALNQKDGVPRVLTSGSHAGKVPCLWGSNDRQILFWNDEDFSASLMADGLDLFSVPSTGGVPKALGVTTLVHEDMISLSPDGRTVAVSAGAGRESWKRKRIAVIDLETAAINYLTRKSMVAIYPSWSPQQDRVAFAAAPSTGKSVGGVAEGKQLLGARRIWMSSVSGASTTEQLTSDDRYRDEKPRWSVDGTTILFCRVDRVGERTIWTLDIKSQALTQVAGPLHFDAKPLSRGDSWFGYYGYIDWRSMLDWHRG